jgi:hypothetical protein
MLYDLDREVERRGNRFARNADECSICVKSRRAGWRVFYLAGAYSNMIDYFYDTPYVAQEQNNPQFLY